MERLIDLLSPEHTSDVHSVVAEMIKGIISIAAPSPGAAVTESHLTGPASNRFARELARSESVLRLVDYMLDDFRVRAEPSTPQSAQINSNITTSVDRKDLPSKIRLPNTESAISSVVQSIGVIIELIRKNNSDYFEPYLFHTLRNRLIQVQQNVPPSEDSREILEKAMKDMVERLSVVHLGPVLDIMSERLGSFQQYLRCPRSSVRWVFADWFKSC
jgi:serine/threonine-protein phosphatase 6 regulatory subunit 3